MKNCWSHTFFIAVSNNKNSQKCGLFTPVCKTYKCAGFAVTPVSYMKCAKQITLFSTGEILDQSWIRTFPDLSYVFCANTGEVNIMGSVSKTFMPNNM